MSAQNQKASGIIGALAGMLGLSALAGVLVTVMVTPALAVTGMAASNTIGIFEGLPEYIRIDEQSQRNTLWAQKTANPDDGYTEIATVYYQNREEAGWDDVSQYIKDAVLAGEDRRFYDHNGVDVQSIVRAAVGNVASGDIESGASTLTMQLVKNLFINEALQLESEEDQLEAIRAAQETSLERKLKEAKLAIGLEKQYTKNEILLAYLNIAGFGGNTYGIEAAAQEYFGVTAADVTIAQAASLIAIVQQPGARSLKSPENYPANQARRDFILDAMLDEGFITAAEHREAIDQPVDEEFVNPSPPSNGCMAGHRYAKFFCDFVVENVDNFESLGSTVEERRNAWRLGGLDVYTTLNLSLQKVAQDEVWNYVPRKETALELGGTAVSVETGSGRIITMAQNKTFDNTLEGGGLGTTAVNFNTDQPYGGSGGFQTGSTYKVFALLEWLKQGHGLNEYVDSTVRTFNQASFTDSCVGGWGGPWTPKNDAPAAPAMSAYRATTDSVNTAFVAIAQQLDLCGIRQTAESIGVHRADGAPLETNPSSVLGTNNIAPMTMAAAFAAIANDGRYCEPIAVDRFVTRNGEELPGQAPDCRQGLDPEIAAAAAYAMQGVMSGGTGVASNPRDGVPIIGKTGTTDRSKQTWVVGSTREVATAVWVGNIKGDFPIRNYPSGGSLRHLIFKPLMTAVNGQYGGGGFPDPPGRLLIGSGVELPDVRGETEEDARSLLEGLGFGFEVSGQVDSDLEEGRVASMSIEPGTLLARGVIVRVETSRGNLIELPDVSSDGYTFEEARDILGDAGFTNVSESCSEIPPVEEGGDPLMDGIVTGQNPSGGSKVKYEKSITLTVSRLDCS
ncbi:MULTISPECIES: transglycosylase domain-containing protein [Microcella]|uniref:transglycosylase domain-containing protein n=1 Tax=Microcella TaxID=337004 RepID=UPI0015CF4588|nr:MULTISPECIES: transglycosylase domain-containing protein [Microcella]QOD93959.1 transglycosylase domain-containing protein [Chryseoglobus sp. 28M-23]